MAKPELKAEAIRLRQQERLSLEVIADRLGVSQSGCSYWLRDYPLTKEEISARNKLPKQYPNRITPTPYINSSTQTTESKGSVALMHFLLRAAEKGVVTSIPTQSARYDVVVDVGGVLSRVQVKYAGGQEASGSFTVKVNSIGHSKKRKNYTPDQVDYIAAFSPATGKVYLLPAVVWAGKSTVCLRYAPARNNQKSCFEATDYEY